jgi:NitT/TauT family transport system substrate-binding protein
MGLKLGVCLLVAGAFSSGADEGTEVRIGFFPNITHGQALYARATGEFEKATGAKFTWTPFNAGPTAIESMFTDAIDLTFIGPGPTINGYIKSRGQKFVIISGAASGGSGLVVRKEADIKTEKDFAGRRIATPQLGNTQDIAARVWFASRNIKLKERGGTLALFALANADQLTMFKKKEIDGAWTTEPWLSRLEIEGGGQLFLDEKTLWPDGKYVTTHLIVNKTFLSRNPDLIRKLLDAHVAITQKINSDKAGVAKTLNEQLKKDTGKALKEEVITRALERVEFTWSPISSSLFQGAEAAHRIGFLRSKPKLDGVYALDLLNEVLKEKGLPPVETR